MLAAALEMRPAAAAKRVVAAIELVFLRARLGNIYPRLHSSPKFGDTDTAVSPTLVKWETEPATSSAAIASFNYTVSTCCDNLQLPSWDPSLRRTDWKHTTANGDEGNRTAWTGSALFPPRTAGLQELPMRVR